MTVELLVEAYSRGIFPWTDHPVRWYSPDPRAIFEFESIRIPKRVQRLVRQGVFQVTFDRQFEAVMRRCRGHHSDAWITGTFLRNYAQLHRLGYAHSVEVWQDERLVGGLYGVQVNGAFAGESMFYTVPNASKVGFAHLVEKLKDLGVTLFDAQVLTPHTERLGAINVRRQEFLARLELAQGHQWQPTSWRIDKC